MSLQSLPKWYPPVSLPSPSPLRRRQGGSGGSPTTWTATTTSTAAATTTTTARVPTSSWLALHQTECTDRSNWRIPCGPCLLSLNCLHKLDKSRSFLWYSICLFYPPALSCPVLYRHVLPFCLLLFCNAHFFLSFLWEGRWWVCTSEMGTMKLY